MPQTYISPDEDRVVLQESQDGFIAAGNMKAVKMPGCGHAPFLNDPQRVAGVIVEAATGP